jgi:hypothetical protein
MHLVGSKQYLIPYTLDTEDFLMTMMPVLSALLLFPLTLFYFIFFLQCLPAFSYVDRFGCIPLQPRALFGPVGPAGPPRPICNPPRPLKRLSVRKLHRPELDRKGTQPCRTNHTPSSSFFYSASCSELKTLDVITFFVATGTRAAKLGPGPPGLPIFLMNEQ